MPLGRFYLAGALAPKWLAIRDLGKSWEINVCCIPPSQKRALLRVIPSVTDYLDRTDGQKEGPGGGGSNSDII